MTAAEMSDAATAVGTASGVAAAAPNVARAETGGGAAARTGNAARVETSAAVAARTAAADAAAAARTAAGGSAHLHPSCCRADASPSRVSPRSLPLSACECNDLICINLV